MKNVLLAALNKIQDNKSTTKVIQMYHSYNLQLQQSGLAQITVHYVFLLLLWPTPILDWRSGLSHLPLHWLVHLQECHSTGQSITPAQCFPVIPSSPAAPRLLPSPQLPAGPACSNNRTTMPAPHPNTTARENFTSQNVFHWIGTF